MYGRTDLEKLKTGLKTGQAESVWTASATLKSGIFPAQTQWTSGGYQDSDGDNVGEYGTLEYLAGVVVGTSGATGVTALQGALAFSL